MTLGLRIGEATGVMWEDVDLERHGTPLSNAQLARRAYLRPQSMAEVLDGSACDRLVVDLEDKVFEAYSPAIPKPKAALRS